MLGRLACGAERERRLTVLSKHPDDTSVDPSAAAGPLSMQQGSVHSRMLREEVPHQ